MSLSASSEGFLFVVDLRLLSVLGPGWTVFFSIPPPGLRDLHPGMAKEIVGSEGGRRHGGGARDTRFSGQGCADALMSR